MKKVYLLLAFCLFNISGFSATWYSLAAGGVVTSLANWNSLATGAGTTPVSFNTAGDVWIIQSNMTIAGATTWNLGGSLQINTGFRMRKTAAAGTNTLNIGGNLTLQGSGVIDYGGAPVGSMIINLVGNLSMGGTSTITNPGTGTNTINFSGAGTSGAPQTVSWASSVASSNTSINVNTGTFVRLLTNVAWPTGAPTGITVNGTLDCGTFVMSSGSTDAFTVNAGATLITANTAGINGSVTAMLSTSFSGTANYIFNGAAAQVTGTMLPSAIGSVGSVTINNSASGVTLSQTTNFASSAILNLENGILTNTAANLVMASGSNVNCDKGTLAVVPTTYSGVNLTYANLGNNALAVTTGNEFPTTFAGNVTVNKPGATISLQNAKTLSVLAAYGNITLTAGTLASNNFDISLSGNWNNNSAVAAFTAGTASVVMNGTAAQTLGGTAATTFNNFTLNNAAGATLGNNETVNGVLTLTSGRMTIGVNSLILGTAATAVGAFSSSNMIVATSTGTVLKNMSSNGSFTYPVGDGAGPNYTPIKLNFTAGTYAAGANAAVNLRNVKDPANANVTDYIKRYWQVFTTGITSPNYTATATYVPGDVVGTEANISAGEYPLALPWNKYGVTNVATHTLVTGILTDIVGHISGISTAPPTVTVSPGSAVCVGTPVPLSVVSSTGDPVLTYSWAPGSSLSTTVGTAVVATPTITTTYTVTVTDGNGFTGFATTTVTINSTPSPIVGNNTVCIGLVTDLTDALPGGTWSSTVPANATIDAFGAVTGAGAGTTTISYIVAGCYATMTMTVNTPPTAVAGAAVCTGQNTNLSELIPGGLWSTSDATATVGSTTGNVVGVSAGTALISYTVPACIPATAVVTINPFPSPITGATAVCEGGVTTLSDITGGGTWSSSSTPNATVGSTTGDVTGVLTGPVTIYYTVAGCAAQQVMTVNPAPAAITGTNPVCEGSTVNLSDVTGVGTWSSANPAIATVNSATGDVTGVLAGVTSISYILSTTGCWAIISETVNATPVAITGQFNLCTGVTYNLSDATGGGTWTSNIPFIASVVSGTGAVTGNNTGTTDITYTTSSNCYVVQNVTVNPSPVAIFAPTTIVCTGDSVAFSDASPSGVWSSSAFFIANVGSAGEVYGILGGGTSTISYTTANGCSATTVVTVTTAPSMIVGDSLLCIGYTITLLDSVSGGAWSSSAPGSAIAYPTTGVIQGVATGVVTIVYSVTGCPGVSHNVTVNANPSIITGATSLCDGLVANLFDVTPGGTWTSGNTSIAIVTSGSAPGSGVATGISLGNTDISYILPTGCYAVVPVTVNPLAPPISGTDTICATGTAWLTDIVGGGTWTSSNPAVATIGSTGLMTGLVTGITYIVYTLPTGCSASLLVTGIPSVPPISSPSHVCTGSVMTVTDAEPGGTWSTSNIFVANIGTSGTFSALYPDTVTVTYTISAFKGCVSTETVTVDPLPVPIITHNYAAHTVSVPAIYATYQWYNDRTGLIPGATTPTYALPHLDDSVSITVTDANGCSGTASWYYNNYTAVSNVNTSTARIYPNPATSTVFIEASVTVRAVISSVDGKVVMEQTDAKEMDISKLANGLYVISLLDEEGHQVLVQKLVKE